MIITCPQCSKRYLVADSSIGLAGRNVRCVACGHGWHQMPPVEEPALEQVETAPPPPPPAAPPPGPPASWTGQAPPVAMAAPSPAQDREPVYAPPPAAERRARRNPARLWTAAAALAALLLLAAILMLRPGGFAGIDLGSKVEPRVEGTALRLKAYEPIWGRVLDGRSVLTVNGRIENPSTQQLPIPPLHAEVRDADGMLLASWTSPPPLDELPGGATISFDTAAVDIPPTAQSITINFATPRD